MIHYGYIERVSAILNGSVCVSVFVFVSESGGGDAIACDTILNAVNYVQETLGKPVVASYARVSASGGYFMSCSAKRILASKGWCTMAAILLQFGHHHHHHWRELTIPYHTLYCVVLMSRHVHWIHWCCILAFNCWWRMSWQDWSLDSNDCASWSKCSFAVVWRGWERQGEIQCSRTNSL